jgi:hypothetical protein
MKGHPIRGFFAGLLLGIVLDLDLFLGGVVKSDATALVIVPIICIVGAFLLGLWAPIGRRRKPTEVIRPNTQPLPEPVAWPESAPAEGLTPRTPQAWKVPPPVAPPAGAPGAPNPPPPAEPPPPPPPPGPSSI